MASSLDQVVFAAVQWCRLCNAGHMKCRRERSREEGGTMEERILMRMSNQILEMSTAMYSKECIPGRNVVLSATANVVVEMSRAWEDLSRDLA